MIRFYVVEESKVVAWKSSMKKVFLNIPQNSQEKSELGFPLQYKAAGWGPATSLNTESCTGAFLRIF